MSYILLAVVCYIIGSFPTAYLVVKGFTGKNILNFGTGNVGTMNTHRATNNKVLTILVLLGDLAKGFLAYSISNQLFLAGQIELILGLSIGGFCMILGHNYSLFLKFKGGKGLASGAGFLAGISPTFVIVWIIIFLLVTLLTRYMVLGQMLASIGLIIFAFAYENTFFWPVFTVGVLVVLKHFPRMKNVLEGTEPKMYYKAKN